MARQRRAFDTMSDVVDLPFSIDRYAVFLDVDGTLIDIAPRPELVVVPPDLVLSLARVREATGGALALVSGRSLETLDALFAPQRFATVGLHGSQMRAADGTVTIAPPPAALRRAEPVLAALVDSHPGAQLEDKGGSIAVHFRGAPDAGPEIERRVERIAAASGEELATQKGKMVIELKPAGISKGSAVAELMKAAPFAGRLAIAFGDDLTDEQMFAVVNELGGATVRVGEADRPTEARMRVESPAEVRRWLAAVAP